MAARLKMWNSNWLPRLFARIFAPEPPEPIWKWAEENVRFSKKHAAEDRYRSSKTPWTRRMQEVARHPFHPDGTRIRRFVARKCTQSGFTEGVLNIIRFFGRFSPRNFLYAINSKEEAENIRARLIETFRNLGENVMPEREGDELGKYILRMRAFIGWFIGSYSSGAFSNKYAPLVIIDEKDDHALLKGNTDTGNLAFERLKTADDDAFMIELGKPRWKGGPIDTAHDEGNCEIYLVPCPHCGTWQEMEWERVRFGFCKDLTGHWDKRRVLAETYHECIAPACKGAMRDGHKPWMNEQGRHLATNAHQCNPDTVSQSISDVYSMYTGSTLGHLALEFIDACAAADKGDFGPLQAFFNGRLGRGFEARIEKVAATDVDKCRRPYRRGTIPELDCVLVLGMDVGLYTNTNWVVAAVNKAAEAWVIDYGEAAGPMDALKLLHETKYPCIRNGAQQPIVLAFLDARYRRDEVYDACLLSGRRMYPTMGMSDSQSLRSISFAQVPGKPKWFGCLQFRDSDAKHDLFIDRIKDQRPPGLFMPADSGQDFMDQFCNEHLVRDPRTGKPLWAKRGKNHWPDALKVVLTGWDYTIGGKRMQLSVIAPENPADPATEPVSA